MFFPRCSPKTLLLPAIMVVSTFLWLGINAEASPVTIDFEGLSDSTIVTTQYPGLTFANAIILTAGVSLNEFEFPPHSGSNVVSDNGGPMTISFTLPATSFSGYFTYSTSLTITVYDPANNPITTLTSAFNNNMALSGDPGSSPNEIFSFTFASGIGRILITGDPNGSSFALDDVTFNTRATSVPEPSTIYLLLTGCAALAHLRKKTINN